MDFLFVEGLRATLGSCFCQNSINTNWFLEILGCVYLNPGLTMYLGGLALRLPAFSLNTHRLETLFKTLLLRMFFGNGDVTVEVTQSWSSSLSFIHTIFSPAIVLFSVLLVASELLLPETQCTSGVRHFLHPGSKLTVRHKGRVLVLFCFQSFQPFLTLTVNLYFFFFFFAVCEIVWFQEICGLV